MCSLCSECPGGVSTLQTVIERRREPKVARKKEQLESGLSGRDRGKFLALPGDAELFDKRDAVNLVQGRNPSENLLEG